MLSSNCTVCGCKILKFIKEQKVGGLLSKLTGIKVAILSAFICRSKFMAEMHLRQPGFTNSACGLFTKNKKIKKLK